MVECFPRFKTEKKEGGVPSWWFLSQFAKEDAIFLIAIRKIKLIIAGVLYDAFIRVSRPDDAAVRVDILTFDDPRVLKSSDRGTEKKERNR